jgi:hypothetical protein
VTNRIALVLALALAGAVVVDLTLTGGAALLFLARRFVVLVEWVAFWR